MTGRSDQVVDGAAGASRSDSADPSSWQQPPFFIMGCPRSGTTLVSQILDSHSRLAVYQEINYYALFRPLRDYYGDLNHPGNLQSLIAHFLEWLRVHDLQGLAIPDAERFREILVAPTFEGVLATVLQLYARQRGKVRGGEKMPGHYAYVPEILDRYPGCAAIFLMRDPRDVARSMRKAFDHRAEVAARSWMQAFEAYRKISDRAHLVRYEELVAEPEEVTEGICAFLGESFEPGMLKFYEQVPEGLRKLSNAERLSGPVVMDSVRQFRHMPVEELARIETICATGMDAMRYELSTDAADRARVADGAAGDRRNALRLLLDRLRYYGLKSGRWRRGWFRWKLVLRVRARHLAKNGRFRPVEVLRT